MLNKIFRLLVGDQFTIFGVTTTCKYVISYTVMSSAGVNLTKKGIKDTLLINTDGDLYWQP
jgi:hypothetical protein